MRIVQAGFLKPGWIGLADSRFKLVSEELVLFFSDKRSMGLLNCQRGYQQVLERGAGQHLMQTRIVWIEMPDRQCLRGQYSCLLYTSPSPRDRTRSRMPSSA